MVCTVTLTMHMLVQSSRVTGLRNKAVQAKPPYVPTLPSACSPAWYIPPSTSPNRAPTWLPPTAPTGQPTAPNTKSLRYKHARYKNRLSGKKAGHDSTNSKNTCWPDANAVVANQLKPTKKPTKASSRSKLKLLPKDLP